MAEISLSDKLKLEKIFEMESGYVLNFSNRAFSSFFDGIAGINIDDIKYQKYGTSKANRLRAFWEIENNEIVARITQEMLLYFKEYSKGKKIDEELYKESLLIAEKLLNIKTTERKLFENDLKHIWGEEPKFKIFISHKADDKLLATSLKKDLSNYGISCFVAHEDIEPSKEWQIEIEKALFSADALVALLTKEFYNSNWTEQEIGIAYARNIDIIPILLGEIPHGFIGKFQALRCDIKTEYKKIISWLLKRNKKMVDIFIHLVENSNSWIRSNDLALFLEDILSLYEYQVHRLIYAFNTKQDVHGAFGFNGHKCNGLFKELIRITGKDYSEKTNIE